MPKIVTCNISGIWRNCSKLEYLWPYDLLLATARFSRDGLSRKSAEEVAEFIEVEEAKAGVSAAKVVTDETAENAMGESDEA